jgi:uncharacterized membrane protein YdjX (TVP38/TMEM64 family)
MVAWCDRKLVGTVGAGILVLSAVKVLAELVLIEHLVEISEYLRGHGIVGQFAFVICTNIWIICMMPTTPLELMSAFVLGFWRGFILNQLAKWTGSIASFLVGRVCAGSLVRRYFMKDQSKSKLFWALNNALETDPFRTMMLVQLALMPIAFKNYGLSTATDVPFPLFAFTAFLGELPTTIAIAWTGSTAHDLLSLFDGSGGSGLSTPQAVLLCVSVVFLVMSVLFLGRSISSSLAKLKLEKNGGPDEAEEGQHTALLELAVVKRTSSKPLDLRI